MIGAIAGNMAEAHDGGVPEALRAKTFAMLDERLTQVVARFVARFMDTPGGSR